MKIISLVLVMMYSSVWAVGGVGKGTFSEEYGNFMPTGFWNDDGQYIFTVSDPSSITLNEGEVYIFLNAGVNNDRVHNVLKGGMAWNIPIAVTNPHNMRMIVGPAEISVGEIVLPVSYKILRPIDDSNLSPLNIISLPADNNGDVDLLIETSPDLQTWTPIYSDSIGTTGSASFIRTRLLND